MKIIFFGAPGSGKGTQSKIIAQKISIAHLSTGDILRNAIKNETPIGIKAAGYMNAGNLVPDETIIGVLKERILEPDCRNGYLLDGFPRTVAQAESLDQLLGETEQKISVVINLEVDSEKLVERLTGRRICSECGAEYHIKFKPSKTSETCDLDDKPLIHRPDDREKEIRIRLQNFERQTVPLINYYQNKGILKSVDGQGEITEISSRICGELKQIAEKMGFEL